MGEEIRALVGATAVSDGIEKVVASAAQLPGLLTGGGVKVRSVWVLGGGGSSTVVVAKEE